MSETLKAEIDRIVNNGKCRNKNHLYEDCKSAVLEAQRRWVTPVDFEEAMRYVVQQVGF